MGAVGGQFPRNQLTGQEGKKDDKPYLASVTKILFEKNFRQTSPSFKQIF